MKYLYGQFNFSFSAWPKETTINFVFSNLHLQILCAQADIGEMFITVGPDHFPEIQDYLLSLNAKDQNFTLSNYLPEWAVGHFVSIEIDVDGETVHYPLNMIEDDVVMQLISEDCEEPAFRPEVVAGMLKYITVITGGDLPSKPLQSLHADVLRRMNEDQAYTHYRAETLKAVIQVIKKLLMAPSIHANMAGGSAQ